MSTGSKRLVFAMVGCTSLQVCLPVGGAHAEPTTLPAQAPTTFHNVVHGVIADADIGTSADGDTLMGELGGQWAGVTTFGEGRWLLEWDGLVAARGGYLASQYPFLFLIGGHEIAWAEGGYRFCATKRWSPYLGGHLGDDARIMAHPGLALSDLDTINNVDRVGGAGVSGVMRVDLGASSLDARQSVLLVAFVEEVLQSREVNTGSQTFTGAGLGLRFDVVRGITASAEVVRGVTPTRTDTLRGLTDQTTRTRVSAAFRRVFHNQMWLGASISLERDTDHVVYPGSGTTYDTANAPAFGLTVLYGFPLFRGKMQ